MSITQAADRDRRRLVARLLMGACQLFACKDVQAGGWCSSWEPQM